MVSRQDQTFVKLNLFRSCEPLFFIYLLISLRQSPHSGADPGGVGRTRRAPPSAIGKNMIFLA